MGGIDIFQVVVAVIATLLSLVNSDVRRLSGAVGTGGGGQEPVGTSYRPFPRDITYDIMTRGVIISETPSEDLDSKMDPRLSNRAYDENSDCAFFYGFDR